MIKVRKTSIGLYHIQIYADMFATNLLFLRNKKAEQNKVSNDYWLNHFSGYIIFSAFSAPFLNALAWLLCLYSMANMLSGIDIKLSAPDCIAETSERVRVNKRSK